MSKITIDTAVLEHVLEWFEWFHNAPNLISKHSSNRVHEGLREALAQPQHNSAPAGYVLVPNSLIDKFPEINPSNYGHDDACALNRWGCEVVTAAIERQSAAPQPQPVQDDAAYKEAVSLATSLFKKHFAHEEHYASGQVVWSPCDTAAGVISQIDNMVSGLVQPQPVQQDRVAELEAANAELLESLNFAYTQTAKHDERLPFDWALYCEALHMAIKKHGGAA